MTMCVIYLFIIQYWYICFGDYRDTCTLMVEDASYLILIPPCKVVIVGVLNLKMAALHFVNIRLKVVMQ